MYALEECYRLIEELGQETNEEYNEDDNSCASSKI